MRCSRDLIQLDLLAMILIHQRFRLPDVCVVVRAHSILPYEPFYFLLEKCFGGFGRALVFCHLESVIRSCKIRNVIYLRRKVNPPFQSPSKSKY